MIKNLLFFFLLFFTTQLHSQVTVSNATFPTVGDTLRTATDGAPQGIAISAPGGNQVWDFSQLEGVNSEQIFRASSESEYAELFPNASLYFEIGQGMGNGAQNFVETTDTEFKYVGFYGNDPVGLGLNLKVPFSPPLVQRRAPMNFFDSNTADYAILVAVPADSLPEELTQGIPIDFDSIRLNLSSTRTDLVDAWGTLTIPGGTYDVLREKRVEITTTMVEARIGFGPFVQWVDVTEYLSQGNEVGADTTVTYIFVSDTEKENIAELVVSNDDSEQVLSATYKSNDISTNIEYLNTGSPDMYAYPNPAILDVRVNLVNLSPGTYTFKIMNILGRVMYQKEYYISGDRTIRLDIDTLHKGTYLYNLSNEEGKIIKTKRLMVIRP